MSEELIDVWGKNSSNFPWGGWLHKKVPPPPQEQSSDGDGDNNQDEDGLYTEYSEDDGEGSSGEGDKRGNKDYSSDYRGDGGLYELKKIGTYKVRYYDSLDDFVDAADDLNKSRMAWPDTHHRSSRSQSSEATRWSGSESLKEAIYHARHGWDKGLVRMNTIVDEFHRQTRWTAEKATDMDVAGSHPDVPMFLSGDPANMINTGDVGRKVKPLIHIIVNRSASCGCSENSIFNFGAAMMVCIDQIEAAGIRVELEFVIPSDEQPETILWCTVKKAQEIMEKNRIAFAMAHPSLLRRLVFSIYEQWGELYEHYNGGYGRYVDLGEKEIPTGAIYINGLQNFGESYFENIESSVKKLQEYLGIKISETGNITVGDKNA